MHDTAGAPIAGARVILTDALSDEERVGAAAAADGSFRFGMLPPGTYTLWVEELGFLPRRILGLSVRRGREVRVPVELMPIDPPVMRIDTALSDMPVLENDPLSRSFAHLELAGLPDAARDLAQLTSFAASAGDALEIAGLPGWASGVVVNGLPFRGIRHPFLDDPTRLALFPLSAFDRVALLRDDPDVEWSGFGGGWLLADQRRAPPRIEVSLFGDWTGDALASSARFAQDVPSFRTVRGGVRIGGPILADTAHFVVGAEATRIRTPRARPWRGSGFDEALIASADSLGVELSSLLGTQVEETDLVSVFGRFDWRLGRAQAVSVQANVASVAGQGLNAGPDATWSPRTSVDGTDVNVTVSLTSDWGAVANELRVGFERAGRDYGADTLPATRFVAAGLGFGNDVRFPARFERSGLRVRETFHVRVANHRMKIGLEADLTSFDQSFASGTAGEYVFSGVSGLDARRGVFTQAVGPRPVASFSRQSIGGFMQDHWTVAPGFDFRVGLRYDVELVPLDEVPPNAEWFERTGLSNDSLDGSRGKISSRAGFTWDVGETGRWIVSAGAGIYYDFIDPALLGELLSHTGRIEVRRGVGDLTSWPASPPDAAAPIIGPRLTLIAPGFEPPRSGKASFGITRAFGRSTAFHVSTSFRHTDFLPRRRDLNLLPSPAAMDQHGRPIYGELVQLGSVLAAEPGSNRRFDDFDLVSALNGDGYSEYVDVRLALESRLGSVLELYAAYTYSRTEDNWLSGRVGGLEGQLSPFPDSLGGRDWADGRSDFDIPHRFSIGGVLRPLGRRGFSVAALYRYRSGYPFTPGFRIGVDANGDGSARNDPAFVDDAISGLDDLLTDWACLRPQLGAFAGRNTCRDPGVERLDLRLGLGPVWLGGYPVELVVDVLNVLDADNPVIDHALVLVDGSQTMAADPTTGTVTVPLVANSNFGRPLAFRATGRAFRFGLRVNY